MKSRSPVPTYQIFHLALGKSPFNTELRVHPGGKYLQEAEEKQIRLDLSAVSQLAGSSLLLPQNSESLKVRFLVPAICYGNWVLAGEPECKTN